VAKGVLAPNLMGMGQTTVGVIDNNPLYRAALARLVAETPDLELCAAVGSVARFVAERRCANCLVLLDFELPRPRGAVAVRAVTGLGHRVLALSAGTGHDDARAAMAAGAVGYLDKSAEAAEILEAVHQIAVGNRSVPAAALLRGSTGLELSGREVDVLTCLAAGERDEDIACSLRISVRTVRSYLDRIRDKTGLRRRSALTRYAIEHGIIAPADHVTAS
jgi:DNA-binding NarL/FixJ family response regulator